MTKENKYPLEDTNIVAVYWTLKKPFGNHASMIRAEGKYIGDDFIEFKNIDWGGFPIVNFEEGTGKFLAVELYEVSRAWVQGPLDSLEGHPTFYYRKALTTLGWVKAIGYEYASPVTDRSKDFQIETPEEHAGKTFYEWMK